MNRGNGFPYLAALGVTMVVGVAIDRILGGLKVGRETSFVIFGALFAGAFAFFIVRRLIRGPDLERDEWLLMRDELPGADTVSGLAGTTLIERLARHGYAVQLSTPQIWQTKVTMIDPQLGKGELRFEIGNALPPFFGTIEIDDNPKARYGDLATCVLYELGEMIPDVRFKRTYSTLPEEPTRDLQSLLPAAVSPTPAPKQ